MIFIIIHLHLAGFSFIWLPSDHSTGLVEQLVDYECVHSIVSIQLVSNALLAPYETDAMILDTESIQKKTAKKLRTTTTIVSPWWGKVPMI